MKLKNRKLNLDIKNWTNSYLKERKDFLTNREKIILEKTFLFNQKGYLNNLEKLYQKIQQLL